MLLLSTALAATVDEAFPPPTGAEQVATDGFGAWLRDLELEDEGVPVTTYDGRSVDHPARVVRLDLVDGDLQQCADSIIRLRSQWLMETGATVSWHATSGDPMPYSRYRDGETPYVVDDRIAWKRGGDGSLEGYLARVFIWAGTASLEERDTVATTQVAPGNVLVQGGFPGHAVLILDVARRADTTYVLLGEGFMPAQSFHVELGPHDGWYRWDEGVPDFHWPMAAEDLRAFK